MNTVVIIDDHEIIHTGLSAWLKSSWRIAGEASSLKEAEVLFAGLAEWPDLVLLDIELSGDWGLDLIGVLRNNVSHYPASTGVIPPVLVYSMYNDYAHINAALRAGAQGYICKSQSMEDLLAAMDGVVSGNAVFPVSLIRRLTKVSDLMLSLTKREREIFDMVQRRFRNKEIAAALGISVRTVENNLSNIYDKTGVKYRDDLEKL
jgi:DNA-binding NarL/FixJ family response regulator